MSANVSDIELKSPDPSQKITVREELLDANPGRPGAPISLPGLPTESAAGGIKAPQYFVPGVAGDHRPPGIVDSGPIRDDRLNRTSRCGAACSRAECRDLCRTTVPTPFLATRFADRNLLARTPVPQWSLPNQLCSEAGLAQESAPTRKIWREWCANQSRDLASTDKPTLSCTPTGDCHRLAPAVKCSQFRIQPYETLLLCSICLPCLEFPFRFQRGRGRA